MRQERRKVDRSKLAETDFDKEMLFGNTFSAEAREEANAARAELRAGKD